MKKLIIRLFSVMFLLVAVAAEATAEEERISADGFLFHFNKDKTAMSLWFCNTPEAVMTLPDKVYYDAATKKASLKPFGNAKAYSVESLEKQTFWGAVDVRSITLPASYRNVGEIAFRDCVNLTTFKSLGKNVSYSTNVFLGCNALTDVTIDASRIGAHIFDGCVSLVNPHLTGNFDHVPDDAFKGSGVKSIDFLPESVTAIWADAFSESQLEGALVIPKRFKYIENGAFSLTNISSVTIPEGTTKILPSVFAGCKSLTVASLPSTLKSIGSMAFSNTALKELTIPNTVEEIEPSAFFNCTKLERVTLPDKLKRLEKSTFNGTALRQISLPATLTSIAKGCFTACFSLSDVYCYSTVPPEAEQYSFNDFDRPTIHVPFGTLQSYKAAATWKEFKRIVEMPVPAGIDNVSQPSFKVIRSNGFVHVSNAQAGQLIELYSLDGVLISKAVAQGADTVLPCRHEGPVIIKAGKHAVTIAR